MDIEFELLNNKLINIIAVQDGKRKIVGNIFTPSGSGHFIKNAIQVCGCIQIFDYWGCAVFARNSNKDKVVARLTETNPYIQVKDIQLMFDWDVEPHNAPHGMMDKGCLGCYNNPCTCDNNKNLILSTNDIIDGKGKKDMNPYNLKRAADLELEEVK